MIDTSEKNFEAAIETALLGDLTGPATLAESGIGVYRSGGYHRREPADFDRDLCLIAKDVVGFLSATQPKEWQKMLAMHGADAKPLLLKRLAAEIHNHGTLHVLRKGIKANGCKFQLVFFQPSSGLNESAQKLYRANQFAIVRQLHYSQKNENSLDLAIFLNGLPLFTAELKNPFKGQSVQDAVKQYRLDRDPKEPLFHFGRCLAHFAVDPSLVYVTTELRGGRTAFLPFNQGRDLGAGNPPSMLGFSTAYLWEQVWARDSVLNLLQHFIHIVEIEDDKGNRTGEKKLLFPRYHQLDCVRRIVADALNRGAGQCYLVQHSAGSGKSNTIAWLAHQLSVLHDAKNDRIFDSIIVVTDRRVLDRQLQRTVRQFEQTLGVVENIDTTSRQLKQALEDGKTIIVTTLQKFPVIADQIGALKGKRFAVIIDEAHSSQSGESTKSLKTVLAPTSLEEAEKQDAEEGDDLEDRIVSEMKRRGRLPNVSYFAFTATPKNKTLELFGRKRPDGKFEPFSLYSMRQAIEEKFILDVLENYTTYQAFWALLKKTKDDPNYDREKAEYLLKSFVGLSPHTIEKKVAIMVEHFSNHVQHRIGGKAKAMIVTRSRLHAVRYKLAVDAYLKAKGYPFKALVAFSGTVKDGGRDYTESGMNSESVGKNVPETATAATFHQNEFRILIVASKFQTGFDEPLLHTMYVDKKLGGVNAVQTLSRLNRICPPDKEETMVLDFANEADEIQKAFQPYYERTLLKEATDPNLLYDLQTRLDGFHFFTESDVQAFAVIYFSPKGTQDKLHGALAPVVARYGEAPLDTQSDFRGALVDFVRLYAFLSQVITFTDPDLERLYVFAKLLWRLLPVNRDPLPVEVQNNIDLDAFRLQRTGTTKIQLKTGTQTLDPMTPREEGGVTPQDIEPLSKIIKELNDRFGTDFSEEDKVFILQLEQRIANNPALAASLAVNPPEDARLTFNQTVNDALQDMVHANFKFYKQITDNPDFANDFLGWLFERYRKSKGA
ncbi:MAG TPA: type I restriction endonuclease [Verrucomicrobiota bacterium]|nr:type I restriction endonuclease [Verrucomicrobiota bacterium]HNU51262.1 type I restriction endonuclease [Verrucomicrobiota bacterium]